MLGNNIILTEQPRGRRIEGVAYQSAMYPGTCVTIVAGVAADGGGRFTWQPWSKSTGYQGLVGILDVDWLQGFTPQNPGIQIGKRIFIYFPLPGDELNMLLAELAGSTGDPAITLGEELIIQTGSGQLVPAAAGTAGGTNHSFEAWEVLTTTLGQEWVHCVKV